MAAGDLFEPGEPPAELAGRIRSELERTLRLVRGADRLPWPDLTQATLAEMRFKSVSSWLPPEEAAVLRLAFEAELVRLYEVEDHRDAG